MFGGLGFGAAGSGLKYRWGLAVSFSFPFLFFPGQIYRFPQNIKSVGVANGVTLLGLVGRFGIVRCVWATLMTWVGGWAAND